VDFPTAQTKYEEVWICYCKIRIWYRLLRLSSQRLRRKRATAKSASGLFTNLRSSARMDSKMHNVRRLTRHSWLGAQHLRRRNKPGGDAERRLEIKMIYEDGR